MLLVSSPVWANVARIDSLNNLGNEYIFSNIIDSIELYSNLAEEARGLNYEPGEALALQHLAIALSLNGLFDDSVEAHLLSIRLLQENDMQMELANGFGELGYRLKNHDLDLGKNYMRQGINIAVRNDLKAKLCALYDNFGVIHEMDSQPDSAAYYYNKALDLKYALNDSIGIPFSLFNLAAIHAAAGQYDIADSLLTLSDGYLQETGDEYNNLVKSAHWGDLNFSRGDLEEAEKDYLETLSKPQVQDLSYLVIHCYGQLTQIYEKQNDYARAFASQQRFTSYRDSLDTVETSSRIAELEIEFESEKKDRLLAENQLAIEARSRQLMIMAGLAVLLLAAAATTYRYQLLKRRQIQREMKLREKLKRSEYEQRMADEKLRISRELHDNIGSHMTFLVSSMDNLALMTDEATVKTKLDSISEFGRTTLSELRNTVWAMRHGDGGFPVLKNKLNELKRQCSQAGHVFELDVDGVRDVSGGLSSACMLNLYRIAQEAVQNSIKHSGTKKVIVRLEVVNNKAILSVEDSGQGFVESELSRVSGLDNMKHRCQEVGGQFSLTSNNGGTCVSCQFPLD